MNGRSYRGMSAEERLAERRERLISAAYVLYSELGFPDTTIEKLCTVARISNRAFYECFESRDELMLVVYDRCVRETLETVAKAVERAPDTLPDRIEAGISEYIRFITGDRRRARIMYLEVRRADDGFTASRQQTSAAFCQILETSLFELPEKGGVEPRLVVLGLLGVVQELLIEWTLAADPPPVDQLVGTAVHIFRRSLVG
ncbi:TetR/AcrR family transcriptional regulator [Planomonospora sp. ID91781]|uniref:TetR family transcriptional regulator n=2 Tax=Streptosporangiaceae TaxID=2004 RepID=A0A171BQF0_9ACTN|nr:TetR/AcrR family transcriptional regulator [Planomonospora sp. ID91781]GAT65435.1 tetR family transcriptional regulator [Planomonospora sphaerica]